MNKSRKIIIVALTLIVAMVVGYALFNETITINGTAKAEGKLSVTATCTKGLAKPEFKYVAGGYPKDDNNYKNDTCIVSGNKVSYSAELQQPEAIRNFTIKLTNSGTIDAVLSLDDGIIESSKSCIGDFDTGEFNDCDESKTQALDDVNQYAWVALEKTDGTIVIASEDNYQELLEFMDETGSYMNLKPGESAYFIAYTEWGDLGTKISGSQKVLFKEEKNLTFTFKQPTTN